MRPIKLGALLQGIGESSRPDTEVRAVTTDSRLAGPGSVFVAVQGERFDGHDFIEQAFRRGAAAAISEKPFLCQQGEVIRVENSKDAYIGMAGNYKKGFKVFSAAVTGSAGKTTTKEMLAGIFGSFGNTVKNEGNRNNEIGLSQSVFEIGEEDEFAVFEMGMNSLGDIAKLTAAVRPDAAIITCVGLAHIERLKTRRNILKAKLEVIRGMPSGGVLVINGDDGMLMEERDKIPVKTVTFAIENKDADVTAKDIMVRPGRSEFTISDRARGEYKAEVPAIGNHIIMDALAAYALAVRSGLDPTRSAKALGNYRTTGMRQRVVDFRGVTVIEDCYNANPASVAAALSALSDLSGDGIHVAVLGDMLELGCFAEQEHRKIGVLAAKYGIDVLLCIGENMKHAAAAAKAAGITEVEWFSDKAALARYLIKTLHSGDTVIFKGSRGMALEEILEIVYAAK